MTQHITLLGYEQVQQAARQMMDAATEMQRAANNFADTAHRVSALLDRFEDAAGALTAAIIAKSTTL